MTALSRCLVVTAALWVLPTAAVAMDGGLGRLADTPYGWLGDYLGKVAVVERVSGTVGEIEVCSAVVVHRQWILTAAHCVYRKNAGGRAWTPAYFGEMYPLGQVVFRLSPMRAGTVYRVVDHRQSENFPDPGAVQDDWVFLKLDRELPVDPARMPEVADRARTPAAGEPRISGFVRVFGASGRLDVAQSNEPRMSRRPCAMREYVGLVDGPMPGLVETDCIPAVNYGLSGAPMLHLGPPEARRRPAITALQTGAGRQRTSREQVPVLVRSERFFPAYLEIARGEGQGSTAPESGANSFD